MPSWVKVFPAAGLAPYLGGGWAVDRDGRRIAAKIRALSGIREIQVSMSIFTFPRYHKLA
jgi:hypothetical protein